MGEVRVSADGYGGGGGRWGRFGACGSTVGGRCCGVCGAGAGGGGLVGRGSRAHEVAADADVGLDHGAPAQDNVLGSVELRFARYFVAGVGLDIVASRFGGGFGRHR